MRSGLVISGSVHSLLLMLLLANGILLLSDPPNISSKNMDIFIISEAEFDAQVSAPPSVEIDSEIADLKNFDLTKEELLEVVPKNESNEIKQHEAVKMVESELTDTEPTNSLEINRLSINNMPKAIEFTPFLHSSDIVKLEEKLSPQNNTLGNESRALQSPSLKAPMPRNEDRIDQIASDDKTADSISDGEKLEFYESTDEIENEKEKPSTEAANKAATTEITPDGTKDVPIVVSGEVQSSVIPPSRELMKSDDKMNLGNNTNEQFQNTIDSLVASISEDQVTSNTSTGVEISTMEKLKLRKSINQLISRHWNKGILIGGSDLENYVVKIEILLDSKGNIIGDVRPIEPAFPSGRHVIAFREASNAIKAVGRIPIPSEKYKNGLKLKLTFDPASGIGFD